jgi:hypothetical protein
LVGLEQLHKDGGFKNISIENMKNSASSKSNVKAFLESGVCIINSADSECYTPTDDVYNEYVNFCDEVNETPVEMNVFGRELGKYGIEKERIRNQGSRDYYYVGIRLLKRPIVQKAQIN